MRAQSRASTQPEPVMFIRLFMAVTGIITSVSGLLVLVLTVLRQLNPAPAPLPVPRPLLVVFTLSFLLGSTLQGMCWVMTAMSRRIWNSTS